MQTLHHLPPPGHVKYADTRADSAKSLVPLSAYASSSCHVCGDAIPVALAAGHIRKCLVTHVKRPAQESARRVLEIRTQPVMCISCLQHVPVHDLGRHLSNCVKPPTRPTPIAGSARLTGSSASPATPRRDSAAAIATATPVQRHQPERVQSSPVIKKAPSKRIDDVDNDEDAVPLEQSRPPDVHAAYSSSYDNEVDPGEQEDIGDRLPCPICKRKFAVASLERHEVACAKLNSKRRPVFNTQAKRVLGTELEKFVPIKGSGGGGGAAAKGGFDDSIPAISKPTGAKSGMGKEAPKARTGPRGPQMDMVSCPSCSRSFSADAAERHIPPCKERKIKEAFARKSNAAADDDMLQKRTKYQPPSLKRH